MKKPSQITKCSTFIAIRTVIKGTVNRCNERKAQWTFEFRKTFSARVVI